MRRRHGLGEAADQGGIGRGCGEGRQLLAREPAHLLALQPAGLPSHDARGVEQQHDIPPLVAVEGEGDRLGYGDYDAELLDELARQRLFGRLAVLDRAPRELPQPAEVGVRQTPGEKDTAVVTLDDGRHHDPQAAVRAASGHPSAAWPAPRAWPGRLPEPPSRSSARRAPVAARARP